MAQEVGGVGRWTSEHIDLLIERYGRNIGIVWTQGTLAASTLDKFLEGLERWRLSEEVPLTKTAIEAVYDEIRGFINGSVEGRAAAAVVPIVILEPGTVRLCWFDLISRAIGKTVWSYAETLPSQDGSHEN